MIENSTSDLTDSNIRLTERINETWKEQSKAAMKQIKNFFRETTVEPCLFMYQLCVALSSLTVQNMHLDKTCRLNFQFGDDICDRIRDKNTTGLEKEVQLITGLAAKLTAFKFPLQTAIPAVMSLFIGAWSDKYRKRKICILMPFVGEIIVNIGLLLATYFFYELSLIDTVLIEALPSALAGSYIILFLAMYSFMTDRTSIEDRTFRLGIVAICVNIGTPTGTALSGVLLRTLGLGYYGMFSLILVLHVFSFIYALFRLKDFCPVEESRTCGDDFINSVWKAICEVMTLVWSTVSVALRPREYKGRTQIFLVLALYLIMVGPLYGDSQVSYFYAIQKFNIDEVEWSLYNTLNIVIGLFGTFFCISYLSKQLQVQDSVIGALAGVSRIASCFVLAFAPSRRWFYSATVFNIFSYTSLTAIRSIACKSVPVEEVAKLSALVGVAESLAPSIYGPTSSFIYNSTNATFPGAFYLFDASLTFVALAFFAAVYVLVKRRRNAVTDPARKEEFARTNEVSTF